MKNRLKILTCFLAVIFSISGNIYASGDDAIIDIEESGESIDLVDESVQENYNYDDYNFEYKRLKGTVIEAR